MLERISMMTAFLDFSAALEENEGVALCNSNDFGRRRERERGEPPVLNKTECSSTMGVMYLK